jgi:hypothetical protein
MKTIKTIKKCTKHNWLRIAFERYDAVGGVEWFKCTKCKKRKKEYTVEYL